MCPRTRPADLSLSQELLDIIACPGCRGALALSDAGTSLVCPCGERFSIKNGIPILLLGKRETAYDGYYGRIDFAVSPYGYDRNYLAWRKGQINRRVVECLTEGRVLDDGGGYGALRKFLDPDRHRYCNMDASAEMLKYDTSAMRCVGEGEALPFRDEVFDNVVSGDVLEHVRDKVKYLREAHRVLRRGGVFVLNTPRQGWVESYKRSIWFWFPHVSGLWAKVGDILRPREERAKVGFPDGVVDIPSGEGWLRAELVKLCYEIMVQSRTDNHPFSFTGPFWRKFADLFHDPEKYGHCAFFACRKI